MLQHSEGEARRAAGPAQPQRKQESSLQQVVYESIPITSDVALPPSPCHLHVSPFRESLTGHGIGVAVSSAILMTSAAGGAAPAGYWLSMSASSPATCGHAMDVPTI